MASSGETGKRKRAVEPTERSSAKAVDQAFRDPKRHEDRRIEGHTKSAVTGRKQHWVVLHGLGLTQEDDTKPCVCVDAASWLGVHESLASLQQQLDDCRSEVEELRLALRWHPDRVAPALQLHFETLVERSEATTTEA